MKAPEELIGTWRMVSSVVHTIAFRKVRPQAEALASGL